MTEDTHPISLHQSDLKEWWQSISHDGLSLLGYFEVLAHSAAELSNGTKLNGMQVSVTFNNKVPHLERGIGTIELVNVEPDNISANADVYLQKPYFDELWKELRQGVPAEYALAIEVAPVLRTTAGYIWNISERMSLFVLSATINIIRRPSGKPIEAP